MATTRLLTAGLSTVTEEAVLLEVPAGGTVTLAPGGYHLMIMGLTKTLEVGGKLELDLVFEHAGKVVVQAEVRQG
jgi:copper(I)-binding protein